jgi:hypothetical protein
MKYLPYRDRQGRNENYQHHNRSYDGLENGARTFHFASNDQVERRGIALPSIEAALSQSSTPPWHNGDDVPAFARPIVRRQSAKRLV